MAFKQKLIGFTALYTIALQAGISAPAFADVTLRDIDLSFTRIEQPSILNLIGNTVFRGDVTANAGFTMIADATAKANALLSSKVILQPQSTATIDLGEVQTGTIVIGSDFISNIDGFVIPAGSIEISQDVDRGSLPNLTGPSEGLSDLLDKTVANGVDLDIQSLPQVSELTWNDESRVKSVRAEYNSLTSKQKAKVKYLNILEAAEARMNELSPPPATGLSVHAVDDDTNDTNTVIMVDETAESGNRFVYRTSETTPVAPNVGDNASSWTALPEDGSIAATYGQYVQVAEIDELGKVVRYGVTQAVVEEEGL